MQQPYQDERAFAVPMQRPAQMAMIERVGSKDAVLDVSVTTLEKAA
jgi:hypothetical protein